MKPLLAMVITIKNERNLLRDNLLYHHKLGVDRFYVFLDGTDDGSEETISDLPYVQIMKSVPKELYEDKIELQELIETYSSHHTARQCLNSHHAIQLARREGFDWVISLDPDELVCPDIDHLYPDQLKAFFSSIPEEIELVIFTPLEVVPRNVESHSAFQDEILFKKLDTKINHKIYDPYNKRYQTMKNFYGQKMGKSAVRTSIQLKPKSVHRFSRINGERLSTGWYRYLLHYNCFDFNDFLKKYKNLQHRPDTNISGNPIEFTRWLWRNLVNDPEMSTEDLKQYYSEWIIFSPDEVKRLTREKILGFIPTKPKLITVNSVRDFIATNDDDIEPRKS